MVPLQYLKTDSATGCRIGGACPVGLESQFALPATQYFGTFPLLETPGHEFSIFHRFDPLGNDVERFLIPFNNQILAPSKLIWVVVHEASVRSNESPNMFEARGLELGSPRVEEVSAGDDSIIPEPGSKLGGRCLIFRYQVREVVPQLEANGYLHLLQIGDGRGRDFVAGFPWDPGFLNVWALDPADASTYRFCVQQ